MLDRIKQLLLGKPPAEDGSTGGPRSPQPAGVRVFSNLVDTHNYLYTEWEYSKGDPWAVQTSVYEHGKLLQQLVLLGDRHYDRVLDVGCGAGFFTSCLAKISKEVIGFERSPEALRQARAVLQDVANVSLVEGNIRS